MAPASALVAGVDPAGQPNGNQSSDLVDQRPARWSSARTPMPCQGQSLSGRSGSARRRPAARRDGQRCAGLQRRTKRGPDAQQSNLTVGNGARRCAGSAM